MLIYQQSHPCHATFDARQPRQLRRRDHSIDLALLPTIKPTNQPIDTSHYSRLPRNFKRALRNARQRALGLFLTRRVGRVATRLSKGDGYSPR